VIASRLTTAATPEDDNLIDGALYDVVDAAPVATAGGDQMWDIHVVPRRWEAVFESAIPAPQRWSRFSHETPTR
jgi:hypothetical protein